MFEIFQINGSTNFRIKLLKIHETNTEKSLKFPILSGLQERPHLHGNGHSFTFSKVAGGGSGGGGFMEDQSDQKIENICSQNGGSHILFVKHPLLALHRNHPRSLRQFFDEQFTRFREDDRRLGGDHLHILAGFLHDLLDSR